MNDPRGFPPPAPRSEERYLDPANLEAARFEYFSQLEQLLESGDEQEVARIAGELSPGDLSDILRPLSVEDTARVLRLLPADTLVEVLAEIDQRSLSALFTLLDIDEIADLIEEMPSDEATDVIGELDDGQAREILAAMEEEERGEVTELLQYEPETAGGLMGKEYASVAETAACQDAVAVVRGFDEDDLEEMHSIYVVNEKSELVGRVPLVKLLLASATTPIHEIMESDPPCVDVDLDQEAVAQFAQTHDLISIPVVDRKDRLVGRITADDVMDVIEDEAAEDISHLAGMSVENVAEQSSFRIARSRLPWLLGGLGGQIGSVLVLSHFEKGLASKLALATYIPVIMAMAGNIGMQTSSIVVRGLATGDLDFYRMGRHMVRELLTAILTGLAIGAGLFVIAGVIDHDLPLAAVLALVMLLVVVFAALVGTGMPLLLHRLGADPAVATGPFITTANDVAGLLIYLALATALLRSPDLTVGFLSQPVVASEALVLRTWPTGETSTVASLLTENSGYVRVIAKSARRPRSVLRPLVQPGRLANLEFGATAGRELQYLRGGSLLLDPMTGQASLEKSAYLLAAVELVDRCRPAEEREGNLFRLCRRYVQVLSCTAAQRQAALFYAFELALLRVQGIAPALSSCTNCGAGVEPDTEESPGFSPASGGVLCPNCTSTSPHADTRVLLADVHRSLLDLADGIAADTSAGPLDRHESRQIGVLLHRFLGYHLPGYRLPAALGLLRPHAGDVHDGSATSGSEESV